MRPRHGTCCLSCKGIEFNPTTLVQSAPPPPYRPTVARAFPSLPYPDIITIIIVKCLCPFTNAYMVSALGIRRNLEFDRRSSHIGKAIVY